MNKLLGKAIAIVADAFQNVTDKAGVPYIFHCLTVMNGVPDEDKIPAIFHDYIEDIFEKNIDRGLKFLRENGFSENDIKVIDLLTHRKNEDYLSVYIKKISTCPRATRIKLKDLEHNSQITRIKGLTKKDFSNVEKYYIAFTYLSKI